MPGRCLSKAIYLATCWSMIEKSMPLLASSVTTSVKFFPAKIKADGAATKPIARAGLHIRPAQVPRD